MKNLRKISKKNDNQLTKEELCNLKIAYSNKLAVLRREILYKEPFIGMIAMNLNLVPTRDPRLSTACTDGKSIFFDIAFLESLSHDEQLFLMAHEIWHNVMIHFIRMNANYDHQLWNIATDMEVNQILVKDGFTKIDNCMYPSNFNFPENLSAENYYDLLVKENQKKSIFGNSKNNGSTSKESNNNDSSSSSNSPSSSSSPSKKNSKKDSSKSSSSSSSQSPLDDKNSFDKHIYSDYNPMTEDYDNVSDKFGKIELDSDYNPFQDSSASDNAEKMREITIGAAQMIQKQRGTISGRIEQIIKDLLQPKISWRDSLSKFITKNGSNSFHSRSWSRPNRRFAWSNTYLPSSIGESLNIGIGIDTSGSCQYEIKKFLSEIKGIVSTFGNDYKIEMIQCDSEIKDHTTYTSIENPLDDTKIENFKFKGGGGTRMTPIFDFVNDNEMDINALIIFTDGEIETIDENQIQNDIPVLWVITSDGNTSNINFGEIIKLKD